MNRKDRRAAAKGGRDGTFATPAGGDGNAALFAQALRHHQAGDLREAQRLYGEILAREPDHVKSLNFLGLLAHQSGRNDVAAELIGKALAISESAESHYNLAVVLAALGRSGEVAAHYERAIALRPDYAEAIMNLGNAYTQQRRPDEAIACYQRVLALRPDAAAHYNIANILARRGDLDAAAARYRQALEVRPDLAEAHNNLGNICKELGRHDEAIVHFRRALALKGDYVTASDNLARMLLSVGNIAEAFDLLCGALAIGPTDDTKILIVRCLQNLKPAGDDATLRALIVRALSEGWAGANDLAAVAGAFLKQVPAVAAAVAKVEQAWPQRLARDALLDAAGVAALASDRLLVLLLESAPICDSALERLTTTIRFALLQADREAAPAVPGAEELAFCCAVARQCFINEYVFDTTDEEAAAAARLQDAVVGALATNAGVSPLRIATLAAYVPLHAIEHVDALLGRDWPKAIGELLTQQVREPRREQELRAGIPALTTIDDRVSVAVRRQYEENPYPRWVTAPAAGVPVPIEDELRARLPYAKPQPVGAGGALDVLIAGCGTGRHAVETARRFADARILAVDLSMTSLAYAQRKTEQLGLANITYAQADILALASIGRDFDVIESNGVLHHLADPFAGWRVLVALLRPNGLMNIGLYSETARREVTAVRAYIAAQRYGDDAAAIRACRQDLMAHADGTPQRAVTASRDFYSTSACRDLLFHVQEHQLTIPAVAAFLAAHGLRFLGFELDIGVLQRFGLKFPDPQAVTDLDRWHDFEQEYPHTFASMYQFWVQKQA